MLYCCRRHSEADYELEHKDPIDSVSGQAASHPADEAGWSRNTQGKAIEKDVLMFDSFSFDGPEIIHATMKRGDETHIGSEDIADIHADTLQSAWDSDICLIFKAKVQGSILGHWCTT